MIGTVDKETRKNVKYEIRERKNMKFRKVTAIIGAAVMMMSLAAADLLQAEASTLFPVRTVPEQEELS